MAMTDIIKYEVMVSVQGNQVKILFNNITRAWQNAGGAGNDGFQPVGLWQGSRADNVYHGIEVIVLNVFELAHLEPTNKSLIKKKSDLFKDRLF